MISNRIVVLARDLEAASELRELVAKCNPFHELETVDAGDTGQWQGYVDSLKKESPELALVEVRGFPEIAEVLEPLQAAAPMLPVVVFCRRIENHAFLELHRLGFGNRLIRLPAQPELVERVLMEARSRPERPAGPAAELNPVVSILPGKPGSGASTLAWHFANICAEMLGRRVALLDLDLNCGVQGLFAGIRTGMNLFDAISVVDHTGGMPDPHHVPGHNGVDVLTSMRRCRSVRIDTHLFGNFLGALRATYRLVVADHSGNWERFSVEAIKASSVVFCVCEGDYLSLTLASRTYELTDEMGLLGRMRLVLNRCTSRYSVAPEQAETLSRMRMAAGLPNCFGDLQHAVGKGYLARQGSAYWTAVESLAAQTLRTLRLAGEEEPAERRRSRGQRWMHSLGFLKRAAPEPGMADRS